MMAEEAAFDFFQLFDAIINSSASTTEKLLALVVGRHIGRGGQAAYPSRARLIELASCSLNSFKRSQAALRVFFEAEERRGKATKYAPKPSVSTSEIEVAIAAMRAEGGPKLRPTSQATRTQDEAKGGPKLAPASPGVQQSRTQIEATNGPTVGPQKDSLKEEKKIPPVSPPITVLSPAPQGDLLEVFAPNGDGSRPAKSAYSENFEEFWKLYPHRKGKGAASKSWERLSYSEKRRVYLALRAHLPALEAKMNDPSGGNYCPMPATWLNEKRYDDPVEQPKMQVNGFNGYSVPRRSIIVNGEELFV